MLSSLLGSLTPNYGDAYGSINKAIGYQQPFYQAGQSMLSPYMSTLSGLTSDPTALENQIMGQYTMSPTATYQMGQLTDQTNRAAAMGGDLGTPNEQLTMANNLQGLVSQDQQQYLQNAMQPYMAGLQGQGQMTQMGQQAAGSMGDYQNVMAGLQAASAGQKSNLLGGLLGAGISGLSSFL